MKILVFVVVLLVCRSVLCEDIKSSPRDSYLDAYSESHGSAISQKRKPVKIDREYVTDAQGFPYPPAQYGPPGNQYGPPTNQYGPPAPQYGPPSGPPSGPPKYAYGPPSYPAHSYPPSPPVYGPPVQTYYEMPHALLGFLDKLKLKFDLFLIGKILLKLVIFKKIVSFIAILCLLLFIPHLKKKLESNGEDNMARKFQPRLIDDHSRIENIAAYVSSAIETFTKYNEAPRSNCETVYCKTNYIAQQIENKITFER